MKKVLILGIIGIVALGITGYTFRDKLESQVARLERRMGINVTNVNLAVNSDTQICKNGVTVTAMGRIEGINTATVLTVPRGLPKTTKEMSENFKALGEMNGAKIESVTGDYEKDLSCETLIKIKTDSKISHLGFTCFTPEDIANLETNIKEGAESLINCTEIKDSLSTDNELLVPVHISADEATTAIYWVDSSGKTNAIPLHFSAYEGKTSEDKGHAVDSIDTEIIDSGSKKSAVVEVKNYGKTTESIKPKVVDAKTGEDISSEMGD